MSKGAQLVIKTLKSIEDNTFSVEPQPLNKDFKTAYKLNRDNTKIDWTQDVHIINNLIRGLSPYPSAWCTLYNKGDNNNIKIFKTTPIIESHNYDIGKILIEDSMIKVAAKNGYLVIEKLQLPGKKAMDSKALLNGYTFYRDARMG